MQANLARHIAYLSICGDLDAEAGELYGTRQARKLAAGRPTVGHWTARRLILGDLEESWPYGPSASGC